MQLIEIKEPNIAAAETDEEIAVGIDFGTTNSLVAISRGQQPQIIVDQGGGELIPSVISWHDKGFVVGNRALKHIYSIKRLLGKSKSEVINTPALVAIVKDIIDQGSESLKLKIGGQSLTVPEIAAEIFKHLKKRAIKEIPDFSGKVVVTVPAYFDDAARGEVMLAAKIAGFQVLRLISEPTAAAYAYGLNKNKQGCYLVYDLGGGTFDVSVLNMQQGILQVIATAGDNMLGGDDIDLLVANYFQDKYKKNFSNELLQLARQAKEALTDKNEFSGELDGNIHTMDYPAFAELITPLLNRTVNFVKEALAAAHNPKLDGIILVGGSTRIPLIGKMLKEQFNVNIHTDVDPDKVVAFGAALQAENLTTKHSGSLLIDVVPLSIGMELYGGLLERVILRNSPIPVAVTKEFTTYADNQTAMQFHIVQGEREMVKDCRSLARFELTNIPPLKAGMARIEVTFAIDADGILSVSALEKQTGRSQTVVVKPTYGLDTDEVNRILENAYKNAVEDYEQRVLQESITAAESLIYNLKSLIGNTENILQKANNADNNAKFADTKIIEQAIEDLNKALKSENLEIIVRKTKMLEEVSGDFVSGSVDLVVADMVSGKHISEF